ncbi:hypothetical protein [Bifidobacterium oedipodis]|uniref:Uncharacterized protein n=1 Tax=Bifidobacterium oedipodis TaxID=2675322 RepID=A0A7Y0EPT0_9BIFI|nr:hypothetical protein [Bifidobacterium sp. DSM 109957]NMM94197.1 hypothetical protein [Bifidobacterium sp. DSM 109957]
MGLWDKIAESLHIHAPKKTAAPGEPMTFEQAKELLTTTLLEQPLSDMKLTAQRAKRLNDEMPQFVTFAMSHYFNRPRLVRFTNEGGKQIDADAISRLFAQTTILQFECEIQRMIGDLDEMRGRLRPDQIGHVDPTPIIEQTKRILAASTATKGDNGTGHLDGQARAWLYALMDQSSDIDEATGGNQLGILKALGNEQAGSIAETAASVLSKDCNESVPAYCVDPTATTTDYMKAYAIITE